MSLLFEKGVWERIRNEDALRQLLQNFWEQPFYTDSEGEITEEQKSYKVQQFLNFRNDSIQANNYVGFIQNDDDIIEIYPKVFKNAVNASENKNLMLRHIFYWFSYCRKWKFPFSKASLDVHDIDDFPELIINLISNHFLETVSKQPHSMYQEVEESLQTPRGAIDFNKYLNGNFIHGNFQNIDCTHEPFVFDNKVNRLIKYCTRLLLSTTNLYENQRILQEIIFVLDEVEDVSFTGRDIENIAFNSIYEDYVLLVHNCKLVLNRQLYSNTSFDLSQWCLLFPMEYIFEDFLAGYLEDRFHDEWYITYQKSDMYLATNEIPKNVFQMKHDIFISCKSDPELKIIVDTKYKIRGNDYKKDDKKGVEQEDLYQVVSYALRRGCSNVLLVYPNISENLNTTDYFEIESGFDGNDRINVHAMEIPFWSFSQFDKLDDMMGMVMTEKLNNIKINYYAE